MHTIWCITDKYLNATFVVPALGGPGLPSQGTDWATITRLLPAPREPRHRRPDQLLKLRATTVRIGAGSFGREFESFGERALPGVLGIAQQHPEQP